MKTTIGGNDVTSASTTSSGAILIKSEPLLNVGPMELQGATVNTVSKRPASLDLKQTTTGTSILNKKQQQHLQLPAPLIIDSSIQDPGSSKTTLGTPDLEKILHLLPTPQPGRLFPTKASAVTSEQEAFGKGFEDALHSLHNSKSSVKASEALTSSTSHNTGPLLSGGSFTYTNLGKQIG